MGTIEVVAYAPVVAMLAYIPYLCYRDWKYRDIPYAAWIPLLCIGIASTLCLYVIGAYPLELLWVSLAFVGLYFMLAKLNLFASDDFIFLALITMFFVVNPISGRVLMPLVMFEMLVCSTVVSGVLLGISPIRSDSLFERFPYIFTISLALILTVILG